MKSKFIFPIISIIQIFIVVGLLMGIFLDPIGIMHPFFKGEISADLIFFSQSIVDVSAMPYDWSRPIYFFLVEVKV